MAGINLSNGQRAQRKALITVAEWIGDGQGTYGDTTKYYREILGARVEDSSISLNPDTETMTDILGVTHTDVNKTEPQQDLETFILGGSDLSEYLTTNAFANNIDKYNGVFNLYIITAFIDGSTSGKYYAVCHSGCTILPTEIGGDSYNKLNLEVHFSNNLTEGEVDKLSEDFTFTAK